ncbi:hypothetical protein [Eremococcus coleocola]|uniref:hypothetical protein n=1 Tax=Eremococcus coleocola TaxID=88132 RepID=UPI00048846B0|nr:hypothetical protein [Eremococcus coleocola]
MNTWNTDKQYSQEELNAILRKAISSRDKVIRELRQELDMKNQEFFLYTFLCIGLVVSMILWLTQ